MSDEQPTDESWDGLLSNYLKAEDLKDFTGHLVCTDVDVYMNDKDEPQMDIEVEVNGRSKIWGLNKTNRNKLKELGLEKPKALIGKKITYKKVTVQNPNTKKEVESLRIVAFE